MPFQISSQPPLATQLSGQASNSPTVANGVVYAGRNSGELLAWPESCVANGGCDEIWKGILDDPLVTSSPTVVNGKIYIGGSEHGFGGRLYVFGLQP